MMIRIWAALMAVALAACSSPAAGPGPAEIDRMLTEVPAEMGGPMPITGMAFDEQYLNMMIPHQEATAALAAVALERAGRPEIREMAQAILLAREGALSQMRTWKHAWFGAADAPPMSDMPLLRPMEGMGGMGQPIDMLAEVDALERAPEPFDLAFIDAMIAHRQRAVDAAEMALTQSTRPEILAMAQAILDAQQPEIEQLKAWRAAWFPEARSRPGSQRDVWIHQ